MNYIDEAKKIFDIEIEALTRVRDSLSDNFLKILQVVSECKGKVIITGMGKPGHIGRKIAATMASLGTEAFYLHPAEALHGDLGMIGKKDVVIAISYSGESDEIINILTNIKIIGATLIGITGNENSTLAKMSDHVEIFPAFSEACYLNLAPTSSTTASLVYGDALAVVASRIYGFDEKQYGLFHPAGALGKKLLVKVSDIMATADKNAVIHAGLTLKNAIIELGKKGLGMITIVDDNNKVLGVITDGDLRRQLEKGVDVYALTVDEMMTKNVIVVSENEMAVKALQLFRAKNISGAPVVDQNNTAVGTIRLHDILEFGIV